MCFDVQSLTEYQHAIQRRMRSIEEHARRLVRHTFSLSSPKEVALLPSLVGLAVVSIECKLTYSLALPVLSWHTSCMRS